MKTLLLKMSGPLQSWGTRSHFETRHTDFYPSKSAVIGIISASFGYRREDDEKIHALNNLQFAVRIDQQGTLMRDYHTARKYKKTGDFERTYVTNRYYLEDAVFVIGIGHEDKEWIEQIQRALETPYYQPFMGRRSLPLPADFILSTTEKSVMESLQETPWQGTQRAGHRERMQLTVYADAELVEAGTSSLRKDYVLSFSQKERKFGYRSEVKTQMEACIEKPVTQHDAFSEIGE